MFRSAEEVLNELKSKAPPLYNNIYVVVRRYGIDLKRMSWEEFLRFVGEKMGLHIADLVERIIVDSN